MATPLLADQAFVQAVTERCDDTELARTALDGKTVVITGANGTVGSILAASLHVLRRELGLDLHLLGLGRGPQSPRLSGIDLTWVTWDLRDPAPAELSAAVDAHRPCLVLHAAAETRSSVMTGQPLEVFDGLVAGTRHVLEWASGLTEPEVVLLSSMEVYGSDCAPAEQLVTEADLGRLDLRDVRSVYPEGKRVAELLCTLFAHTTPLRSYAARLGQVVGAGVGIEHPRAISSFVAAALAGDDIVLRTDGASVMNFIDSLDLVAGVLHIVAHGDSPGVYNLIDPEATCTVAELAAQALQTLSPDAGAVRIEPIDRERTGYAAPTHNRLSAEALTALGWQPRRSLGDSLRAMGDSSHVTT